MSERLAPELRQVLRGLSAGRVPGFNFPGYFLQVTFDRVGPQASTLSMPAGPHCVDAHGHVDPSALFVFADIAIGTSIRRTVGQGARMATAQMSLQFPVPLLDGRLVARCTMDGFVEGTGGRQAMSRLEVLQGRRLVCTGSATFVIMQGGDATPPHPMPKASFWKALKEDLPEAHDERNLAVWRRAQEVHAMPGNSFVTKLFGFEPRATATGATCRVPVGAHIGNRVGNAQGGILYGLAAATAKQAAPHGWIHTGGSAWFTHPGTGDELRARSRLIHAGRSTAVVHTEIHDGHDRTVLTLVSSHTSHHHARETHEPRP